MKHIIAAIFSFAVLFSYAQSEVEVPLADQFDAVTEEWIEKTTLLSTYEGVNEYCRNPLFRKSVDRVLEAIHSYDSLILSTLDDPTAYIGWNMKEEKKTRADIAELEEDFSMEAFVEEMRSACLFRNEIEANAENLKNGVGYESYDAKVLVLETEVSRFLKKIDRLILKIDLHLHELHLD